MDLIGNTVRSYRPHRGGFHESMDACRIVTSRADIVASDPNIQRVECISVYGYDTRNQWPTYIVIARWADGSLAPCGFTDGPLP